MFGGPKESDGAYASASGSSAGGTQQSSSESVSFLDQLSRSYPFFTLFGIPVRIHALFPAFIAVNALVSLQYGAIGMLYATLMYGPILFGTVYIHELGHCFAAKRVGGTVDHILLWPLGGLAYVAHSSGHREDIFVAVAGPATHFPMMVFWWVLKFAIKNTGSNFFYHMFEDAFEMNVVLLVFNLFLPAYPLDGGRVLVDVLMLQGYDADKSAKITAYVSIPIGLAIGAYGIYAFIVHSAMAMLTVFVACWMLSQAQQIYQLSQEGRAREHPMFSRADAPQAQTTNSV